MVDIAGSDFFVTVFPTAIQGLALGAEAGAYIREVADKVAEIARQNAPRQQHSHGGAVSIHGDVIVDGGEFVGTAGWDREHYYMFFPEHGTRYQPARPFLVPALDRYASLSR